MIFKILDLINMFIRLFVLFASFSFFFFETSVVFCEPSVIEVSSAVAEANPTKEEALFVLAGLGAVCFSLAVLYLRFRFFGAIRKNPRWPDADDTSVESTSYVGYTPGNRAALDAGLEEDRAIYVADLDRDGYSMGTLAEIEEITALVAGDQEASPNYQPESYLMPEELSNAGHENSNASDASGDSECSESLDSVSDCSFVGSYFSRFWNMTSEGKEYIIYIWKIFGQSIVDFLIDVLVATAGCLFVGVYGIKVGFPLGFFVIFLNAVICFHTYSEA